MHTIVQVFPTKEGKIYLYFADGSVRRYDATALRTAGGVFRRLQSEDFYMNRCTVLNGTLAWDVSGTYDRTQCIDLDPDVLYAESERVVDPLATAS